MVDLNEYKVNKCPETVFYIPNFITQEEEENLMKNIYDSPKPKWTQLKNRRLQNWGGIPHSKGMIVENIPSWLNSYCNKIGSLNIFDNKIPNHILINEYEAGQGIMPHEDGSLYFPTVSTISLGSHTLLDFYKPLNEMAKHDSNNESSSSSTASFKERYMFSLLLEPRSLLILRDDMYKVYLHGIKEVNEDFMDRNSIFNFDELSDKENYSESSTRKRTTRISLTIRYVSKLLKVNLNSVLFNKKSA